MPTKLPTQKYLVDTAYKALRARNGFEKKGGQCKRFVRQIQEAAGVSIDIRIPTGISAKQAAKWYRDNHPDLICDNGGLPGDIYFWESGSGGFGHCAIRGKNNELIQNSEFFAPEDEEDARGVRLIKDMKTASLIVRTWRGRNLTPVK